MIAKGHMTCLAEPTRPPQINSTNSQHKFYFAYRFLSPLDSYCDKAQKDAIAFSPNEIKIELAIRGLAQLGLGEVEAALKHVTAARDEMVARNTLTSWYWRLAGEWGITDALLLSGDLVATEACAQQFQERACVIEERSWRSLAAEARVRVAIAGGNPASARTHLARAWAEIEGYDAALVKWRLYSVEALVSDMFADTESAARHRQLQADELEAVAATLSADHPSRDVLIRAQPFSGRAGCPILCGCRTRT